MDFAFWRTSLAWLCLLVLLSSSSRFPNSLRAQDASAEPRILLRNLERITDFTIKQIDEDGLQVQPKSAGSGHRQITWDEVQDLRLASPAEQSQAEKLLKELGEPLFRLRSRLAAGNIAELAQPSKQLYPRFVGRKGSSSRLVLQSSYLSHLHMGEREEAIVPYLLWLSLAPKSSNSPIAVPGDDPAPKGLSGTGVDPEAAGGLYLPDLIPIGFEANSAKKILPELQNTIRQIPSPRPPACYLYFSAIAVAAGDLAEAKKGLTPLEKEKGGIVGWKRLAQLQVQLAENPSLENAAPIIKELRDAPPLLRGCFVWTVAEHQLRTGNDAAKRTAVADLATLGLGLSADAPEPSAMGLALLADALRQQNRNPEADTVLRALETRYAESSVVRKKRRSIAGGAGSSSLSMP